MPGLSDRRTPIKANSLMQGADGTVFAVLRLSIGMFNVIAFRAALQYPQTSAFRIRHPVSSIMQRGRNSGYGSLQDPVAGLSASALRASDRDIENDRTTG